MGENCHWRNILLCLTGLALSAVGHSAMAQVYDDPAIAICELVAHHEQLQNPTYERVSADINGHFASIIYEIAALNMAPTTQIAECRYWLTSDGFVLDLAKTRDERDCQVGADWSIIAPTLDHQSEEMIFKTVVGEPHMAAIASRGREVEPLLRQVVNAGAYPIPVGLTRLGE